MEMAFLIECQPKDNIFTSNSTRVLALLQKSNGLWRDRISIRGYFHLARSSILNTLRLLGGRLECVRL